MTKKVKKSREEEMASLADSIHQEAESIRDVVQGVIDAYVDDLVTQRIGLDNMRPLARNTVASGKLASKAAVLGILLVQYQTLEEM